MPILIWAGDLPEGGTISSGTAQAAVLCRAEGAAATSTREYTQLVGNAMSLLLLD
jgi:hypothetical protein